jgi:ribulose-5-phosphate 4-epimerase/fuculose-1-phosphate aldolase
MALSALPDGLLPLTQHACRFYNRIAYHHYEGIVFEEEERPRLIHNLEDKRVMILKNHGFLTAGRTMGEAFSLMFFLEKAAEAQLLAQSTHQPLSLLSPEVAEHTAQQFGDDHRPAGRLEWEALKRYHGF